jgi:hypothetical protein
MKNKFFYFFLVITIGGTLLHACRHEIPFPAGGIPGSGGGNPTSGSSCSPDTVYFANDIMPIISSNCTMSGCHDNITHADGVNLTTYDRIIRYVTPGNGATSKLYRVLNRTGSDRMPPPPRPALTATQKDLILKWINQGAKNNNCKASCDSTQFTFAAAIKPLMDAKCTGCHNPASLGGNIELSTYNGVKTVALNGKLNGSITQQPGYSPMPKNGIKLSDCEIRQVQQWISAGSLNN